MTRFYTMFNEEIITRFVDGYINEMDALREIMRKQRIDISAARAQLTHDLELLS